MNILAIFADFHQTDHLIGFKPFPHFEMEVRHGAAAGQIYPNRLRNLMGYSIYTLPDQIEPRTLLRASENDQVHISGYVGLFIHLLADQLNATLKYPFPVTKGKVLYFAYLTALIRNYTIDVPGTLAPVIDAKQMPFYSHPFEVVDICLMIPRSKNLALSEGFFYLVNIKMTAISLTNLLSFTFLLNFQKLMFHKKSRDCTRKNHHLLRFADYVLNDIALRGILGQPFKMCRRPEFLTKYIYVLLSLVGLYLSLVYNAFLQTFFTRPFKTKQLTTFQELYDSNVYTLISREEVSYFGANKRTFNLLAHITSSEIYVRMRNTLNTSYAYPTTNTHRNTPFTSRQNMFKGKLFLFSENACFFRTMFLGFPMAENSLFRTPVKHLIRAVTENGLLNFWLNTYFSKGPTPEEYRQMLTARSTISSGQPLRLKDFQLVLLMYALLMSLAFLLFLMERIFQTLQKLVLQTFK